MAKLTKSPTRNAIRIKILQEPSQENRKLYDTARKRTKYICENEKKEHRKLQDTEHTFIQILRIKMVVY